MSAIRLVLIIMLSSFSAGYAQKKEQKTFLSTENYLFLEKMTKDVLEASRIYPQQVISKDFGPNSTGGILIRPGGRNAYPSFWIRDYAMSLETGFVSTKEQLHMLLLTASTQCDQAWITKGGSLVPLGAIADHIRIDDSKPIYFPGTYSYENQGEPEFGTLPPYCDQYFFIQMAYSYTSQTGDYKILLKEINGTKLVDRLKMAFAVPPSNDSTHIVYDALRGVDFGFRDAQTITGYLSFASILKYKAANQLAAMLQKIKATDAQKYFDIARQIKRHLPAMFVDNRGMLLASTGKSKQPDVWATALAIYYGIIEGDVAIKASKTLVQAYKDGSLSYKGNIRHILTTDDFNEKTAWEVSLSAKNTYQNGAYWGTPTGWVCYVINLVDPAAAAKLAEEYIQELRENDFRKGAQYGAPYECFNQTGYNQNPVYLTSVSCPLIVFRQMKK